MVRPRGTERVAQPFTLVHGQVRKNADEVVGVLLPRGVPRPKVRCRHRQSFAVWVQSGPLKGRDRPRSRGEQRKMRDQRAGKSTGGPERDRTRCSGTGQAGPHRLSIDR